MTDYWETDWQKVPEHMRPWWYRTPEERERMEKEMRREEILDMAKGIIGFGLIACLVWLAWLL